MPLGMEVGTGPGDVVLDGGPAPSPLREGARCPPNFGPIEPCPNRWMNRDADWLAGWFRPWRHCVRRGSAPPGRRVTNAAIRIAPAMRPAAVFGLPCLFCVQICVAYLFMQIFLISKMTLNRAEMMVHLNLLMMVRRSHSVQLSQTIIR